MNNSQYLSEVAQEVLSRVNKWGGYTRLHDLTRVFKLTGFSSGLFSLERFSFDAFVDVRCQNPLWVEGQN